MRPRSVRLAALFLALLLACLPACSKKVTEEVPLDTPDAETTEYGPSVLFSQDEGDPDLLTGIWIGEEYLIPPEEILTAWTLDEDSGVMTAAAVRFDYPEDEGDPIRAERKMYRLFPGGTSEVWEDAPDCGEDYVGFLAHQDGLFYWSTSGEDGLTVHRRDTSGEEISVNTAPFFERAVYTPDAACITEEGLIVCVSRDEMVLLSGENLDEVLHYDLPGEVAAVRRTPDGEAVVYCGVATRELKPQETAEGTDLPLTDDGRVMLFGAAVLHARGELGEFRPLPEDVSLRAKRGNNEDGSHPILYPASPAWDFCYTGQSGVLAASWDGDGNLATEEILNWENCDLVPGAYSLTAVIDRDTLLLHDEQFTRAQDRYVLFRRAPDVRLSEMVTLTIAHTVELSNRMREKIAEFNRRHPGVRVVCKDYAQYDDKSTPMKDEGAEKLAFELSVGEAGADLLLAPGRADSPELAAVLEKGLYRDLSSFLDADPLVNRENLSGAVLRLFEAADGGIWGLTDTLSFNTLVGSQKTLGTSTGHLSSWTMSEMLDLAQALPPDAVLTDKLYWGGAGTTQVRLLLGSEGWGAYLDWEEGTCSFDSPEFVRLLAFLDSLPKDREDFMRRAPDGRLDVNDHAGRMLLFRSGKLALGVMFFSAITSFPDVVRIFGEDWTAVGYPGSGTNAVPFQSLVLLDACPDPHTAWELIAALIPTDAGPEKFTLTIPALKSDLSAVLDTMRGYITALYDDGSSRYWTDPAEAPADASELDRPGMLFRWTPEFCEAVTALIDGAGSPLLYSVPSEVTSIIEEEISAMTAGASTPENCAKVIQSRVGIWMAERH